MGMLLGYIFNLHTSKYLSGKPLCKEFLDECSVMRAGMASPHFGSSISAVFSGLASGTRALMIAPSLVKRSVHVFLRTKGWDLKSE
jgi:hypothetical protein